MSSPNLPLPLMLFAAGRGARMGKLTESTPKPLLKVAGAPLIDHALSLIDPKTAHPVVVNTHHLGDQLRAHLHNHDVQISDEKDALLETGGGLKKALPLLGAGPVFTLNSDAVWKGKNPLDHLKNAWEPTKMDALLLLLDRKNAIGHKGPGDFTQTNDGQLCRGAGLVYSGTQIIKTKRLADISDPAFSLNQVWDILMEQGRVYGVVYDGKWCDVGHPQGIIDAEEMLGYRQNV